jgi:hypothetical protein
VRAAIERDRYDRAVRLGDAGVVDLSFAQIRAGHAVVWCYYVRRNRPAMLAMFQAAEAARTWTRLSAAWPANVVSSATKMQCAAVKREITPSAGSVRQRYEAIADEIPDRPGLCSAQIEHVCGAAARAAIGAATQDHQRFRMAVAVQINELHRSGRSVVGVLGNLCAQRRIALALGAGVTGRPA